VAAALVGVVVGLGARSFATGSCPSHDPLAVLSSCERLVSSLAFRVGGAAGVAVLLMQLIAAGLTRTAEAIEQQRHAREAEDAPAEVSGR
jgi:hypothetical protein